MPKLTPEERTPTKLIGNALLVKGRIGPWPVFVWLFGDNMVRFSTEMCNAGMRTWDATDNVPVVEMTNYQLMRWEPIKDE